MTEFELIAEITRIYQEADNDKELLLKRYAEEHAEYRIGDIIQSYQYLLRIEKLITQYTTPPQVIYGGVILSGLNEGKYGAIHQNNIIPSSKLP